MKSPAGLFVGMPQQMYLLSGRLNWQHGGPGTGGKGKGTDLLAFNGCFHYLDLFKSTIVGHTGMTRLRIKSTIAVHAATIQSSNEGAISR